MIPKPFAVGVRVIHSQEFINFSRWGSDAPPEFGNAVYRFAARTPEGKSVYTFCMCPGGYVVNASSETGHLCVNGMSYSGRSSGFANSAVVAAVEPSEFSSFAEGSCRDELAGIAFQRSLERAAYLAGESAVPVQSFGDFQSCSISAPVSGSVLPENFQTVPNDGRTNIAAVKGAVRYTNLASVLPDGLRKNIIYGISEFGKQLPGFDDPFVPVLGVESRTSSPVRILRDENHESTIHGLYPAGEGAGYAGGITSAAVDGIKTAEKIARRFSPPR